MPTTCSENEQAFNHLMETVFQWDKATTEAYQALLKEEYSSATDITTMEMDDIDSLMYTTKEGTEKKVPMKQKRLLKHILIYYDFEDEAVSIQAI